MSSATPPGFVRGLFLGAFLFAGSQGALAGPAPPDPADALRLLADITLIDGTCRAVGVDFGRAFQVAQAMGLIVSEAMPAGALRPAFEAATRQRLADTSPDELCGGVVKAYGEHIPGLLKAR